MSDHDSFLQAIFKRPDDINTRLVYADWLDENDFPGGELIRVRHQLSLLDSSKPNRAALVTREQELVASCDQDWLERLERADWKVRYLLMRPEDEKPTRWAKMRQGYWAETAQNTFKERIVAFEAELKKPLPRSWKSFALGCGPGELGGYSRLYGPTQGTDSVVHEHFEWFRWNVEESGNYPEGHWLRSCVCFGWTIGGEALVWDTSKVTDPVRTEYEVAWLDRSERKYKTFPSFPGFWAAALDQYKTFDNPSVPFSPY